MNKGIGSKLHELRRGRGLSQRGLAEALAELGIDVTNQAISKWENGSTLPNARQFLALCQVLDVADVQAVFLGRSESGLLSGLNAVGIKKVLEYAELLRLSGLYDASVEVPVLSEHRSLPVYTLPDSPGTEQLLDSENYELVTVGEEVPLSANFGVYIKGVSMEPDYSDGDIVWIQQQQSLSDGEVGVFMYNGGVYLKRLRDRVGGIRLQSVNRSYPDIVVTDPQALRVLGKALG
jgi:SOS-response transcriptional repressor LexA